MSPVRNPAHSTDDKCTDEDGVKYIVEMQLHYQASLSERMVYYSAAARPRLSIRRKFRLSGIFQPLRITSGE